MLKVECEKCRQWVALPVHADLAMVECPTCVEQIPVKDVFLSAGQFLICRELLKKSMHKYKRIVEEAEQEVAELQKNGELRANSVTAASINGFIKKLKAMLDGCRGEMRHRLIDEYADYVIGGNKNKARVINMSPSGLCLETRGSLGLETLWKDIAVSIRPRRCSSVLLAKGRVMWIGRKGRMGIKFSSEAAGPWLEAYLKERVDKGAIRAKRPDGV